MSEYTLKNVATIPAHDGYIWCCAWSPGGTALATCSSDLTIKIWKRKTSVAPYDKTSPLTDTCGVVYAQTIPNSNIKPLVEGPISYLQDTYANNPISYNDWECTQTIETDHKKSIRAIAWSPSGRHLAAASFDNTITIWELIDGEFATIATLEGHDHEVKSVNWSSNGDMICSSSRDKSIWVWSSVDDDIECLAVLTGHTQDVKHVKFHPNCDDIISVSYDNSMKYWVCQDDDWECVSTVTDHTSTVWQATFDANADYIATASDDTNVFIYHVNNTSKKITKVKKLPNLHQRSIYSISWSKPMVPVGVDSIANTELGFLATGGGDDMLNILHVQKATAGTPAFTENPNELIVNTCVSIKAHDLDINCVAWNPKITNLIATVGDDNYIKIWRLEEVKK